jgi:20S proteasome alpha/beta subunit
MAVQFDKGVVIGADSRTTTGSYIVTITRSTEEEKALMVIIVLVCRQIG